MSVMISSLVFSGRGYGDDTTLGVAVDVQVKSVANKELESWGCYTLSQGQFVSTKKYVCAI